MLLDLVGAGTVYRLWVTGLAPAARIKFYFDGETTPRINLPLDTLFAGTHPPFVAPLVGNNRMSSGGFYSYVPLPFQRAIKITVNDAGSLFYYNIGYHLYAAETEVTTWTSAQDSTAARALCYRAGQDPKSDVGNTTVVGVCDVAAGVTQTLLDLAGPRSLSSIKLRVPELAAGRIDALNDGWLQIYWDDEPTPSVSALLGAFFALGRFGFYPTRVLGVGVDEAGDLYVYFPMPFETRAIVQIVNQRAGATTPLAYEIKHRAFTDGFRTVGYFKTQYRFQSHDANDGADIVVLDAAGVGHWIGVVLSLQGKMDFGFLEGDEKIFVDDWAYSLPKVRNPGSGGSIRL